MAYNYELVKYGLSFSSNIFYMLLSARLSILIAYLLLLVSNINAQEAYTFTRLGEPLDPVNAPITIVTEGVKPMAWISSRTFFNRAVGPEGKIYGLGDDAIFTIDPISKKNIGGCKA